ncbi:hypothetical protein ERIC1_10p00240 (plasmid) [Paenibacillus larvae subsp. larvae DSM 25719]|jgi:hypothetical protein|nr:hypothetical protein ERIC1_10p00240 [Paenibacillus larvae subsp. larvae DSM 25719]
MEEFLGWVFTLLLVLNLIIQILIYRQVKKNGEK